MSVVQMSKLAICTLRAKRKPVLETLQGLGVMHILEGPEEEGVTKLDTMQKTMTFEKSVQSANAAIEILNTYAPEKKGLLESLNGKPLVEGSELKRMEQEQEKLKKIATKISNLEKEKIDIGADILKARARIDSLTPWKNLDIPMNSRGTRNTSVIIGTMPGEQTEEAIKNLLAERAPEADAYDVEIISILNAVTYLAVIAIKSQEEMIENALREAGFARPANLEREAPAKMIVDIEKDIRDMEGRISVKEAEIKALAHYRKDLMMLADYYRIRADKYNVLSELAETDTTVFIEGFVPADQVEKVKKALEPYDTYIDVEEISEEEDVPVLLKNNRFSASAEGVLEAFGLPAKGEMDPTFWMSVFYVFLFGIMLSDAAYGAVVSIVCGILIVKCPRMEKGMRRLIQLFFWCGLSTIFWGVLFGGYFGDAITVVAKTFFNKDIVIEPLWFAPLDDPMKMLIWSLIFGLIHLLFGLGLKGYMLLKNKDVVGFIFDVVCWFCLIIGLVLMLVPTSLFAGIAGQQITLPDFCGPLSKILAGVGALGILFMSARDKKNFGLRVALGAYDLYGITGWLSDVLSYSRLLALGLATGVMATVFNQMGSMVGGGVLGAIVFILVFLIGHTFNLAINLLGTYVHTSRLQYVEFFGKFFEGGGKPFEPFNKKTKYVEFKEEI